MSQSTSRRVALALLAGVTLSAGCVRDASDLFEPDWRRVLDERGELDGIAPEAVPRAVAIEPPLPPDLSGDGPIALSVEQAVMATLRRNRDLDVAQLTPVITGAFEDIERGRFDPEVFGEARFAREEALESARSTGSQFSVRGDEASLAGGVRQVLPTGTDVELGVTQDRTNSDRAPEQQTARVGLTVTQSLLRGAGVSVNLASVRQAELETAISRFELRGFVEAIIAETEIAYWQYLLAQRKMEIVERSLEVARQQSTQVLERIEVGVLAQTEAAAGRSEVALREQAMINARSELRASRLRLFRLMDVPMTGLRDRVITPTSDPVATVEDLADIGARVELARRLRPDLNEARLRLEQSRLETIRTRSGLLPRLDLFVALGKTGYADTFVDSFRELDGRTFDLEFGVLASQSLGRHTARGLHQAAVATRQQAGAAIENLAQLMELDVHLAVNEAERAREQIGATATTRLLQEETARAEVERLDVGSSTTLLVAQAQRDLLVAQIAEVEAVANFRIALIDLYLAEGSLLERRGINVTQPTTDALRFSR